MNQNLFHPLQGFNCCILKLYVVNIVVCSKPSSIYEKTQTNQWKQVLKAYFSQFHLSWNHRWSCNALVHAVLQCPTCFSVAFSSVQIYLFYGSFQRWMLKICCRIVTNEDFTAISKSADFSNAAKLVNLWWPWDTSWRHLLPSWRPRVNQQAKLITLARFTKF